MAGVFPNSRTVPLAIPRTTVLVLNVMSIVPGPEEPVWKSLSSAPLKGTVEMMRDSDHAFKLVRLEAPAPGFAILNICGMGSQVMAGITFYLYGEQGTAAAARDEGVVAGKDEGAVSNCGLRNGRCGSGQNRRLSGGAGHDNFAAGVAAFRAEVDHVVVLMRSRWCSMTSLAARRHLLGDEGQFGKERAAFFRRIS